MIQMSKGLLQIVNYIQENDNYSIISHGGPDGDSIGSILALGLALKSIGKRVRIFCSDPIPKNFSFLSSIDEIIFGIPDDYEDILLVLDCGDEKRLITQNVRYKNFKAVINIDHHPFNTEFGLLNYCESHRIATAELVYELIVALNIKLTKNIGDPLYLGIITDSGGFGYENTSPSTHIMAADLIKAGVLPSEFKSNLEKKTINNLRFLGNAFNKIQILKNGAVSLLIINEADLKNYGLEDFNEADDLVDYLRNIEGILLAILIKGEKNLCKVSMRSTKDFDVGSLCRHFGGGGHRKAAGFTSKKKPEQIVKELMEKIELGDKKWKVE